MKVLFPTARLVAMLFVLSTGVACNSPLESARDANPQRVSDPSRVDTYFDPQVIAPECQFAPDPLDCTAEAGAREIEALAAADTAPDDPALAMPDPEMETEAELAEASAEVTAVRS